MLDTTRRFPTRAAPRVRFTPTWSKALGLGILLLLINLLWNAPLERLTGGSAAAFFLMNILPSVAAILGLFFDWAEGTA